MKSYGSADLSHKAKGNTTATSQTANIESTTATV
jgi:hypothetical protein